MTSLLIVAMRELRVASRKRAAFRLRVVVAGLAFVVCGFTLWFVTLFGVTPISGTFLFQVLSWLTFAGACLVGCGLTADSIGEEKRNGTLGLLFLTHLRGPAIVLGKLAAHGLLALYSLLAVIPIIALPVLLGGADLESVSRTFLVVTITLLLGLVTGIFASTLCRRGWIAFAWAFSVMGVMTVVFPVAAEFARAIGWTEWVGPLQLLSPGYSLAMANWTAKGLSTNRFWSALTIQLLTALMLLGGVMTLLPRMWREGAPRKRTAFFRNVLDALRFGTGQSRKQLRGILLARNPLLWLCARQRFGGVGFCVLVLLVGIAVTMIGRTIRLQLSLYDEFLSPLVLWLWLVPLLYLLFCLRLAAAASERFGPDKKSGALELLLCTSLPLKEIVRGQWMGLLRRFWGGAVMLQLIHFFVLFYAMEWFTILFHRRFDWGEIIRAPVAHLFGGSTITPAVTPPYIICLAILTAAFLIVVLWIAIGWLGMFMSFKVPRELFAPWAALALLAVPPIPLFIMFAVTAVSRRWITEGFSGILCLGMAGFFIVLLNALFWIFFSRRWIYRNFRNAAAGEKRVRRGRNCFTAGPPDLGFTSPSLSKTLSGTPSN